MHQLFSKYSSSVFNTWRECRWDLDDLKQWLSTKDKDDPKKLYELINELSHTYFDYQSESDYSFFNLWNIGTYFYQLFDSYPYIDYTGTKRAGKSKNQMFHTIVCYNGVSTSDISSSALFRLIAGVGATISIDEYENSSNSNKEKNEQTRTLLNSGFMNNQHAIRNKEVSGDHVPTQYDLYSPKNLAHIDGYDDVLEDRCVEMVILRSTNTEILANWPDPNEDKRLLEIRNLCYRLYLDYGSEVKNLIDEARKDLQITSRELKIWTPILTLALFFEKHGVEGLTESIREKIKRSHEERDMTDEQESLDVRVLKFVNTYAVNKASENSGFIQHQDLYDLLKKSAKEFQIDTRIVTSSQLSKILKRLGFERKRIKKGILWLIDRNKVDNAMVRMGLENPTQSTKDTQPTSEQTTKNVQSANNVTHATKARGDYH